MPKRNPLNAIAPAPSKWATMMSKRVTRKGQKITEWSWGYCDWTALAWACEQEIAQVEAEKKCENAQAKRDLARSLGLDPWKGKRPGE